MSDKSVDMGGMASSPVGGDGGTEIGARCGGTPIVDIPVRYSVQIYYLGGWHVIAIRDDMEEAIREATRWTKGGRFPARACLVGGWIIAQFGPPVREPEQHTA